jgi:hypothetical protein
MKRNGLLVLAMVFGLAAAANASSVSVAFDREEAEPGDTVLLMISGVSDVGGDAVVIDLGFTSPGSYPEPANVLWLLSSTWYDPWDASVIGLSRAVDEVTADPLLLTAQAFDQDITYDPPLDDPFQSGPIVTISMVIPDDGTVGFCDYIDVDVVGAQLGYKGELEDVPEANCGSDSIHIIPEPTTISLLALGAFGALVRRKRR